jgi:pyruvate/2-oxoglutarate dehydrogenase complex dihydrolipoamide acyltransferase (E2) component
MADVILMPRLSDTMTEGVIAAWHKKVGDPVKKGELLAEIETDKATMELESYKEGTLLHIGGDKGSKINVDELLAIVGAPGRTFHNIFPAAVVPHLLHKRNQLRRNNPRQPNKPSLLLNHKLPTTNHKPFS